MKQKKSKKQKTTKSKSLTAVFLLAVFILLLIVFLATSNSKTHIIISEQDIIMGHDDAPVTIVMFTRFQCDVSKNFFNEMYPVIKEKYIDTGKVRFVYKNFQSPTSPSALVTEAEFCAHSQGKFWEYHSILLQNEEEWFKRLRSESTDETFNPILHQYAEQLELNMDAFSNCMYERQYQEKVLNDYEYSVDLRVSESPVLFVNGLRIDGVPSPKDLAALLQKFNYN